MIYKIQKISFVAALSVGLLVLPSVVLAEDLLVVCARDGDCSMSADNGPLFNEDDLKPGDSHRQNIEVRNERDEVCALTFDVDETKQEPNNFADRLFTLIEEGSRDWYGQGDSNAATDDKNLDDLYGAGVVDLGTIKSNETRSFKWVVTFDRDAGNEYQRAETKFDIDLNFECESLPQVNGIVSGMIGRVLGDEFTRFPETGGEGVATIGQGKQTSRRMLPLLLAVALSIYLASSFRRKKFARNK